MTQKKQLPHSSDLTAQTVAENLNLSPKQAAKFARQAEALRHNLILRHRQQKEREVRQSRKDIEQQSAQNTKNLSQKE